VPWRGTTAASPDQVLRPGESEPCSVIASRLCIWQTAWRLQARAVFAFSADAARSRGITKPESAIDWRSAGVIGADKADGADADVEFLNPGLGLGGGDLGVPGDLDGILVVEDEEHRGILGQRQPIVGRFCECRDNPVSDTRQRMKSSSDVAN
jgi:hypothetical protein